MKVIFKRIRKFASDESGATAIEYGLISAAMGLMLIPVMANLSSTSSGIFGVVNHLFDDYR